MRSHSKLIYWALLISLLAACGQRETFGTPAATPAAGQGGIELRDCQLSAPGLPTRMPARCGTLMVYEDRHAQSGRQIALNIAVIPADSRDPDPDPLFFLSGGPGQAATESYVQLYFAFSRINQKHDIVLVDQRGTGRSNPLDCKNLEGTDLPEDADPGPYLQACLESLDADPRLYTTSIAMDDLEQVRASLGYGRINLYGVSYGTRAALTYLRQYPQQVRAVILDGVVPPDEALGQDMGRDAQRALDLILTRCEAEPACQQAFPEVRAGFDELLARLAKMPGQVSLPHPVSGATTSITLTAEKAASAVRLLSYAPETAALLPLILHTANTEDNLKLLASQYLIVSQQLGESISEGMNYSVVCSEDIPFLDESEPAQVEKSQYERSLPISELVELCQAWPAGQVPPGFRDTVRAETPVLLLSGEADPVTPPENAKQVAATLPNSLHLVAPGQGHNVIYRGCLSRIAADFIESGSVQGLDTDCVTKIEPIPFFVNFSGPGK